MKVTIYGAGYVGLVTGACLAEVGNNVCCVDVDPKKVEMLRKGEVPIYEPGLSELITKNIEESRLTFTTKPEEGAEHGLFQFICVGTPSQDDGAVDLSYVDSVAKTIGEHLQDYAVVITKSTVPVGTSDRVKGFIQEALDARGKKLPFAVASNPEFLKEGTAIGDFMKPDRIVVGADDDETIELLRQLYAPFNRNPDNLIAMDVRSSELTKYAANAMLATKISFMNEISTLAEKIGADVELVRTGIAEDPRIGYYFIYPGCGYGGSCFPKDVSALIDTAETYEYEPKILKAVEDVNQRQKKKIFNLVHEYFKGDLKGKTIALWGLAFKPNTDDMRNAPSRVLMEALWEAGARVQAYDPVAMPETKRIYGERDDLAFCEKATDVLEGADALCVVTEWNPFRSPDFDLIKSKLNYPAIFDGRNIYNPDYLASQGFDYYGIGRGLTLEKH